MVFLRTENKISEIEYRVLQNVRTSGSPKKDAITLGVDQAKFDYIVTTDADCAVPKFWLDGLDEFIQKNKMDCVVLPVSYENQSGFLNRFQMLDILSLQGATIGGFGVHKPFLCNGANFAYSKKAFEEVHGFKGNDHISSGDDIFLLEKFIKRNKKSVDYLKSGKVIVLTQAQPNLKALISQRLRWAAKTTNYKNNFGKITGLIVFAMNGSLVCSPLIFLAGIISLKTLTYVWLIKIAIDFLLLFKTARYFEQESVLSSYFLSCLIYPFFCVYIAFISMFVGYKWKGRSYKK